MMAILEYEASEDEDTIVYEIVGEPKGGTEIEKGVPAIYVNRAAARFLARVFAQLAEGQFTDGFHLHLGENFDPEAMETLRIVLE